MSVIRRAVPLPAMQQLAYTMGQHAEAGDVFALAGDLGAGKTTFAQSFITPLLRTPESVTSPTFTLVQRYDCTRGWQLYHADLYRLKHASEIEELGLAEAFDGHVALIEWPGIIADYLPPHSVHIQLSHAGSDREITIHTTSPRWRELISEGIL